MARFQPEASDHNREVGDAQPLRKSLLNPDRVVETRARERIESGQRPHDAPGADRLDPDRVLERRRRGEADRITSTTDKPRRDNVEHVERAATNGQLMEGRSADEVAAIRTSRPSEMRRDAAALWEPVHRRNYTEFTDGVAKGKLEKGQHLESKTVWADEIAPISVTAPEHHVESEEFWHHHDNGPDFYRRMGESYPKLDEQLKKGKSAKELANDPEFKEAAAFWYGNPPLKLEHYKDSYFCDESGHHRVALAHRYQLEGIPAQVREWNDKGQHSS
jgi:hypothetical protein